MNITLKNLLQSIAVRLDRLATKLRAVTSSGENQVKFVDLAPTDKADESGVYAEALTFGTANPKIFNIALTGPYGSGKSSIIQTFLKQYPPRALHISLASFVPEAGTKGTPANRQEVERSVLQQMLYGADANRLPLSRFKRIQSPDVWSLFKTLYITLGVGSILHLYFNRSALADGSYFTLSLSESWLNVGVAALAASFVWAALHHFYVASFGVSLKSISLRDIEISPASDDKTSILNRHLDEIIYFFQSTKYDLVVIEDLDRFNDTEIFVTLREINKLVNENAGVTRRVVFLYALRDDMFVNTDRTKFFEFIIPVIPIINTSNSIDMVLKQGERLELDERLNRQFLREVSRYLNDLRLIQNIFNEYAIYVDNLESDKENFLNTNKLLAVLIYKNVYPRDFELLHRGKGNFAEIIDRKEEFIAQSELSYRQKIQELEEAIRIAEQQTPKSLSELRQIYAMALVKRLPAGSRSVSADGRGWIEVTNLPEHDAFEQLIERAHLQVRSIHNHTQQVNVSDLQNDVDPHSSFKKRKAEIESISGNKKNESLGQIQELRSKISDLRTTMLNELLRANPSDLDDAFVGFGDNGELARFLILEGYLDDTYYHYTSLFHSGRLSPSDNKFLIKIRAFETPPPDYRIENPGEVIAAMRDEDFRQSYVLNIKLVDSLLGDRDRYTQQCTKLFHYLSSNFDDCEDFFEAYYAVGTQTGKLLAGLGAYWDEFVPTIIASRNNVFHTTQVLSSLTEKNLKALAKDEPQFAEFVSSKLSEILALVPELESERLEWINLEVADFRAIQSHAGIVKAMFEKGHFALTIENIEYAYQEILALGEPEHLTEKNFSAIRSSGNDVLIQRIERSFETYFSDVLLALPDNVHEDADAILNVINRDQLERDDIEAFLNGQSANLPSLSDVPQRLHALVFQETVIAPTWENCRSFIESEEFEADALVAYLEDQHIRSSILSATIPEKSEFKPVRQFLVRADTLSDGAYSDYVKALPIQFTGFPSGISASKIEILIGAGKVSFTKENFDELASEFETQVFFVASNIQTYLAESEAFGLDDDFHERLLGSDISLREKRSVIDLMDLNALPSLPARASLVGPILDQTDVSVSGIDAAIVQSLIAHSKPISTQVSLFNKLNRNLTKEEVHAALASLGRPYSEITTGYHTPRLKDESYNLALVKWLKSRGIISSWSSGGGWFQTDDIRVNLKRR